MKQTEGHFNITSLCKDDIRDVFKKDKNFEKIKERIDKLSGEDMKLLAQKMADDYCTQLFWESLKVIFEERYLRGIERCSYATVPVWTANAQS